MKISTIILAFFVVGFAYGVATVMFGLPNWVNLAVGFIGGIVGMTVGSILGEK